MVEPHLTFVWETRGILYLNIKTYFFNTLYIYFIGHERKELKKKETKVGIHPVSHAVSPLFC
jgi:hypothetical protein